MIKYPTFTNLDLKKEKKTNMNIIDLLKKYIDDRINILKFQGNENNLSCPFKYLILITIP